MDPNRDPSSPLTREKVLLAVIELAKGIKIVNFYPLGHPALAQAIGKIVDAIESIPPPETGIEIDVTKNALLYRGTPSLRATRRSRTSTGSCTIAAPAKSSSCPARSRRR